MRTDIAKSALGYLAEFHCHTRGSHDGFTSEDELLRVCTAKRIGLLTITEHDRLPGVDVNRFAAAGIHVISGCEFTCERGSHIIGLFIREPLRKGRAADRIFTHILDQGGIVLIPHPFKAGSGFCALHEDHEAYLPKVSLLELYNGGVQNDDSELARVRGLADKYSLRLVAASDAHKAHHVGYYVTAYPQLVNGDVRATFLQSQGKLMFDGNYPRKPRSLNTVQRQRVYQQVVKRLPRSAKRMVQLGLYRMRQTENPPTAPSYTELA